MLYDLTFLDTGELWPPESEVDRLEKYEKNRQLYQSRAEQVYGHWVDHLRNGVVEQTHHTLGFWARLSHLWPALIVGETPKYTAGEPESQEQQVLDEVLKTAAFHTASREVLVDQSRYGDGLFKVYKSGDALHIDAQSPEQWFPVVSTSNIRDIRYHVLAWTFYRAEASTLLQRAAGADAVSQNKYLRVEIHEAGRIENRLYKVNESGRIGDIVKGSSVLEDWPGDVVDTGTDFPLVVHAPGRRASDELFGQDDYTAIDSSMEYILDMIAQRQITIYKHNDPSISGPPIAAQTDQYGNEVYASGGRYFEIDAEARVRPEYMVWDAKMEASYEQEDRLWRGVYRDSETSETIFSFSQTGQAESGTSLRLRCISSLKKAEELTQLFEPAVMGALESAGQLIGADLSTVTAEWRDGLPEDEREQSEISERDVNTGIRSRKSEMIRRFGYNEERADQELEQIADEQSQPAEISASPDSVNRADQILQSLRNGSS